MYLKIAFAVIVLVASLSSAQAVAHWTHGGAMSTIRPIAIWLIIIASITKRIITTSTIPTKRSRSTPPA
jgi:hypothetical protein